MIFHDTKSIYRFSKSEYYQPDQRGILKVLRGSGDCDGCIFEYIPDDPIEESESGRFYIYGPCTTCKDDIIEYDGSNEIVKRTIDFCSILVQYIKFHLQNNTGHSILATDTHLIEFVLDHVCFEDCDTDGELEFLIVF